jgi:hypothetical protein
MRRSTIRAQSRRVFGGRDASATAHRVKQGAGMDEDRNAMTHEQLIAEAR